MIYFHLNKFIFQSIHLCILVLLTILLSRALNLDLIHPNFVKLKCPLRIKFIIYKVRWHAPLDHPVWLNQYLNYNLASIWTNIMKSFQNWNEVYNSYWFEANQKNNFLFCSFHSIQKKYGSELYSFTLKLSRINCLL